MPLQGLGRGIICRGSAALAGLLRAAQLHQLTARKRLTQSAQRVHASASSIEAPGVENVMPAWPHHAAMPPCTSGRAAVASRPRLAALVADRRGSRTFVLKTLQIKTICLTPACNIPYRFSLRLHSGVSSFTLGFRVRRGGTLGVATSGRRLRPACEHAFRLR